jgi:hypothetical protein
MTFGQGNRERRWIKIIVRGRAKQHMISGRGPTTIGVVMEIRALVSVHALLSGITQYLAPCEATRSKGTLCGIP